MRDLKVGDLVRVCGRENILSKAHGELALVIDFGRSRKYPVTIKLVGRNESVNVAREEIELPEGEQSDG